MAAEFSLAQEFTFSSQRFFQLKLLDLSLFRFGTKLSQKGTCNSCKCPKINILSMKDVKYFFLTPLNFLF
jgi:hypothetical protein